MMGSCTRLCRRLSKLFIFFCKNEVLWYIPRKLVTFSNKFHYSSLRGPKIIEIGLIFPAEKRD